MTYIWTRRRRHDREKKDRGNMTEHENKTNCNQNKVDQKYHDGNF